MSNIVDGEKHILKCRNCLKATAEIYLTRPDAKRKDGTPYKWFIRSDCAYGCLNEYSQTIEVTGLFHPGYYSVYDPNDIDKTKQITAITEIITEDDQHILLKTKAVV